LVITAAAGLACSGLFGDQPVVAEELETIEATRLESGTDALPPLVLAGAAPPPIDSGSGVQVLQVAPFGPGQHALQAAVVFDRPMVALSDLDTLSESVPLSCAPDIGARLRWAGTTTAVLVPESESGSFPLATAFECTVPAGITALDGVALENEIRWSFETPRPSVSGTDPRRDKRDMQPGEPIRVWFDQPVDPVDLQPHVTVRGPAGPVPATVTAAPDDPKSILVAADLANNTPYTLLISGDATGTVGPLPIGKDFQSSFHTIPPLEVTGFGPIEGDEGPIDPSVRLELEFSTRVPMENVAASLSITPEPAEWDPPAGSWASTGFGYYLGLKPRTEYSVKLAPGVEDQHGQRLAKGAQWSFTTGDYPPWVDGSRGLRVFAANNPKTLPFRHLNVDHLEVRMASVSLDDLSNRDWDDVVESAVGSAAMQLVDTEDRANVVEIDHLDLAPHLNSGGNGLVAIEWVSPEIKYDWDDEPVHYRTLLAVTDLAATMKVSPGAVEAWVTRLSDGQNVEGVEVTFHKGGRALGTAVTDASGLARLAGQPVSGWSRWSDDDLLWVKLQKGDELGVARHEWRDGLHTWKFGIYSDFDPDGYREVAHAFTDRGIYRLGDPVYARATFRTQDATGLTLPPEGTSVEWEAVGPQGEEVAAGTGVLDGRGGFNAQFDLPEDGRLGTYRVSITATGGDWSRTTRSSVPVRAYRPPAFRVDVSAPSEVVAGTSLEAHVDARYLFGAELATGDVHWAAWTSPTTFSPEGWEGWSFGPERSWWSYEEASHEERGTLASEEGTLADLGTLGLALEAGTWSAPQRLTIEADVRSPDRQSVASSASVMAHPGEFYLGLRPVERLPKAGIETQVELAAVNLDGEHREYPVTAKMAVTRRTWDRVREKGMDGRWKWVSTPVDTEVASANVSLRGATAPSSFTPDEPGLYRLSLSATDSLGNTVETVDSVYVTGSGYTGWDMDDDGSLELVPDKPLYAPGDTARILVKSPKEGLNALITVEREGVLSRQVVQLEGTAETIEIPITEAYLPNVFVSVVAISGAAPQDSPDAGKPEVRFGMTSLKVDAESEHLKVALTTDKDTYRPREEVTVTVAVNRGDAPVPGAGVTLYAVDEAILMLTAYETPDAHGAFYTPHALSVITADSRAIILDRADYLTKGAPRGGGGGMDESGP
jgi:hypothetical protein